MDADPVSWSLPRHHGLQMPSYFQAHGDRQQTQRREIVGGELMSTLGSPGLRGLPRALVCPRHTNGLAVRRSVGVCVCGCHCCFTSVSV